jgi:hypothetical protein
MTVSTSWKKLMATQCLSPLYTQSAGIDAPLAELRSGTTSYCQQDGLGSVSPLSNSAGALASTYTYVSFGKLTASTGTLMDARRFRASRPNSRVLAPMPGTDTFDRDLFRTHSCANPFGPSLKPPFCSEGCITGTPHDIQRLNQRIDAEPGSTLRVVQ